MMRIEDMDGTTLQGVKTCWQCGEAFIPPAPQIEACAKHDSAIEERKRIFREIEMRCHALGHPGMCDWCQPYLDIVAGPEGCEPW